MRSQIEQTDKYRYTRGESQTLLQHRAYLEG
jgi:hypothetical protein